MSYNIVVYQNLINKNHVVKILLKYFHLKVLSINMYYCIINSFIKILDMQIQNSRERPLICIDQNLQS